ncbi:hypothetical protein BJ875DRAFT_23253 [Amylocarpus encephaloides]|uniref:Uncharacterized protein n=1 Tax=Amylocarpus encephaloides TaxID=45428 RepID=A0A9P8C9A5_9HELO|nr:hypothetical protein BJ875DRAFT_23253 [Amylocarpus encephaloides]
MRISVFTAASFVALAFALNNVHRRQDPVAIASSIASIAAEITDAPTSIEAELQKVPSSVQTALQNPTALAEIQSQIVNGQLPDWFSRLPPAAQSYLINLFPKIQTLIALGSQIGVSNGPYTTGSYVAATGTGSFVEPTDVSASNATVSNGTVSTGKPTVATSDTGLSGGPVTKSSAAAPAPSTAGAGAGGVSSTSKAGARPTGVIAAGVFGAVGFLGLALAL